MSNKRKLKSKNEFIHDEFTYDNEDGIYKCNHCSYKLNNKHSGNMESHLSRIHKDIFEDIQRKRAELPDNQEVPEKLTKISINISIEDFKQAIVEIVTLNGRPLSYLDDSGFKKIIKPILGALPEKLTVSRRNVGPWIHEEAEKLRRGTLVVLPGIMLSVKFDLATRLGRSIMGVNIQFVSQGRIQIITLAMREIDDAHTAENLLTEFEEILKSYNIKIAQIYRITSDNGSNAVKMGELLRNRANLSLVGCEENCDDDEDSLGEDSDSEMECDEPLQTEDIDVGSSSTLENTDDDLEDIVDVGTLFQEKVDKVNSLTDLLRCFEHSLQLAPSELIKKHVGIKRLVDLCNRASKKLRTPYFARRLKSAKLRKPILNNKTRWGSTFLMMKRLLELKQFCEDHSRLAKELKISVNDWRKIEKLLETFQPIYETTIYYQRAQLVLSEAFAQWTRMELKLELISNEFSVQMLRFLRKHASKMLNDSCVLAGVFLDPRYSRLLDEDQKIIAKNHIKDVYNFLKHSEDDASSHNSPDQIINASTSSTFTLDPLERFLASRDIPADDPIPTSSVLSLDEILCRFEKLPRNVDKNFDVLKYWHSISGEFRDLQDTANTIFSAASTQVSVERAFSALKFILSDQRGNLDRQLLEDILLLYLNNKFQAKC